MARALTLQTRSPFQLERERGQPNATTFYLRTPNAAQMASLADLHRQGARAAAALYACRIGLVGWESYLDEAGAPVTFGKAVDGEAPEDSINRIPQADRFEIAAGVMELGQLPDPFGGPSKPPPG